MCEPRPRESEKVKESTSNTPLVVRRLPRIIYFIDLTLYPESRNEQVQRCPVGVRFSGMSVTVRVQQKSRPGPPLPRRDNNIFPCRRLRTFRGRSPRGITDGPFFIDIPLSLMIINRRAQNYTVGGRIQLRANRSGGFSSPFLFFFFSVFFLLHRFFFFFFCIVLFVLIFVDSFSQVLLRFVPRPLAN